MPPLLTRLLIGLLFSALIGFAAYRRQSLSASGVLGAVLVGTAIFGFGGWSWGLVLITFFVTSSLLSHYRERQKEAIAAEKFDKGGRRDLGQALANGGVGALIALAALAYPDPRLVAAFVGAMAAANADTWATELGVLSPHAPRLITSGAPVEPGTSGGVTLLGTLAALAGAAIIGVAMAVFLIVESALRVPGAWFLGEDTVWMLVAATLGGLIASLFDSLLGATVQAMYYSPYRHKETEKRIDPNGQPNEFRRGWRWLTNDAVNFASSLVGAGIAAGVFALLAR